MINYDNIVKGSIVAFKSIKDDEWFTGYVQGIWPPNSEINKTDDWSVSILVILPIVPQWTDDGEKTVYYHGEYSDIILLELPKYVKKD